VGDLLASLTVVSFTQHRVPNPYPDGDLPWQVYQTVRNALVRTCRRYGPTGPFGVVQIDPVAESPFHLFASDPSAWEPGDADPAYFVLDDQLNHERYCYAELYGVDPFNAGWLHSVAATLQEFDGWGLGVTNIPDSYVLIFGTRLLVNGKLAGCRTASDVVQTASRLLRRRGKKWWQFWR
jgi:hypothetical protein